MKEESNRTKRGFQFALANNSQIQFKIIIPQVEHLLVEIVSFHPGHTFRSERHVTGTGTVTRSRPGSRVSVTMGNAAPWQHEKHRKLTAFSRTNLQLLNKSVVRKQECPAEKGWALRTVDNTCKKTDWRFVYRKLESTNNKTSLRLESWLQGKAPLL